VTLPDRSLRSRWRIGLAIAGVAAAVRLLWVLRVPTIVVGDFATYRESAIYLSEHGRLDDGFIYMPGLVLLLAAIARLGGEVLAGKMLGVFFGALSAGALYFATAALDEPEPPSPSTPSSSCSSWVVAVLYGLWLPGVAMASVIGTDVPCAAMMCVALAFLLSWGSTRPRTAAIAFGAAMGIAAYFRAVALPLVSLSAVYWATLGVRPRRVVSRALLSAAVTLLVLSPWAIRNLEANGRLSFTDTHGGITALMGNDPNTAGTYSRALSARFHQLTGKTFLSLPHPATDAAAYDIAKGWIAFQPAWTLGMVALRLERLLAPEHGLLYWSIARPGILPDSAMMWFNVNRRWITRATDYYAWLLVLGAAAGISFAIAERRWAALFPVGLAGALLATYALFVAEPRYRLTSEIVVFPTVAWGLSRLWAAARQEWTRIFDGQRRPPALARRGLLGTGVVLLVVGAAAFAIEAGGSVLRDRYRWAVSVSMVDGRGEQVCWRTARGERGSSRVEGTADGVAIRGVGSPGHGDALVEMSLPRGLRPQSSARQTTVRIALAWAGAQAEAEAKDRGRATLTLSAPGATMPFAHAEFGESALEGMVASDALADPQQPGQALVLARLHVAAGAPAAVPDRGIAAVTVRLSQVEITTTPRPQQPQ